MEYDEYKQTSHAAAGFRTVETEEIPVRFVFRDVDDHLSWALNAAGAVAIVLRRLPEDERAPLEAELERAFEPFATGDGYAIPARSLNAVAG